MAIVPNLGAVTAVLPSFAAMYHRRTGINVAVNVTTSNVDLYFSILTKSFETAAATGFPAAWLMHNPATASAQAKGVLMVSVHMERGSKLYCYWPMHE